MFSLSKMFVMIFQTILNFLTKLSHATFANKLLYQKNGSIYDYIYDFSKSFLPAAQTLKMQFDPERSCNFLFLFEGPSRMDSD
jgi:hypothetical protein